MNIECNSNFNKVGFKGYAKVLHTPESTPVLKDVIANLGDFRDTRFKAVQGQKVTDILFKDPKVESEVIEALKKAGAKMVYKNRDITEEGFRLRVMAGNTFEQKAKNEPV